MIKMLKEYRQNKGYTQEQTAEMIGISARQYQRIEKDEGKTTLETIKKAISNKSEIKVELSETADTDNDEKKNFYNTEVNIVKSLYPAKDKEE